MLRRFRTTVTGAQRAWFRRRTARGTRKAAAGNRLGFEPLEPRLVLDSTVVLNEVMYNPAGSTDAALEWIELHNQMAVDMDLSAWKLADAVDFEFTQGTIIPGGGYLVVAKDPVSFELATGVSDALGPYAGQFSNGGELIELVNNSGRLMDSIAYDDEGPWPVASDGSGASLSKIDPDTAAGPAENWTLSIETGGTPGQVNFADPSHPHVVELAFNEVDAAGDPQFSVELVNYGDTSLPIGGYLIASSETGQYEIPAQTIASKGFVSIELGFPVVADDKLYLYTSADRSQVVDGVKVESTLRGRSPDGTGRWLCPDVDTMGGPNSFDLHDEIVINEIMYHHRPTPEMPPVVEVTQPVVIDATWKYDQSDVFPGPSWTTPGFVDGGWSSGESIFYAGPFSGVPDPTLSPITTLFSTGIGASGLPVADGQPDPHYVLTASAHTTPPPPAIPATVITNHPAWLANDASSKWLGPVHPGTTNVAEGDYAFETTFDLTGYAPGSASISMRLSADNTITDVLLNGVGMGITYGGFTGFSGTYIVDTAFVDGINTLAFLLNNAGDSPNPAGFRAELGGTALPLPANTELDLGPSAYYFRTDFEFDGDPAASVLELVPFVDDGAVFYLNGAEVYRHNMPAGAVVHGTLAESNVDGQATFGDRVVIPSGSLVAGTNVLAVEVHQAPAGFADMAFGAELYATETIAEGTPYGEDMEEWIELTNRGASAVSLDGWSLAEGIEYEFEPGTTIGPGEYLVVAKDTTALRAKYPGIEIVGDFSRSLSNGGENVVLLDDVGNPADEVHYYDGGRWPDMADGVGSSLELRDPDADNSKAEAWAASDENDESAWQQVSYRGVAANPPGSNDPSHFHEFIFGLLDAGEILIDDISVVEDPDGAAIEFIQNDSFTTGTDKWRLLGNHWDHGLTEVIADPDDPGDNVLHLVASGGTEHMSNHVETTFANGEVAVNGVEYEISFRAKWLSGSNQLHTRLYFNRLAHTEFLEVPQSNGTPGEENSALAAAGNIGPTYAGLTHAPVVPAAWQSVTVTVTAEDRDEVDTMTLWYSVAGGAFSSVPMTAGDAGLYSGVIPGRASSSIVQFYVEGVDGLETSSTYPAAGAGSRALYVVQDSRAGSGPQHDFRIIMTAADAAYQLDGPGGSSGLSNHRFGATVVFKESQTYYDVGVRLKGSGYSRASSRTGYNVLFDPDHLFLGVHDFVGVDRTASAYGIGASHRELVLKQIANHAGDIPGMYDDLIYFIPPTTSLAATTAQLMMARYDDEFLDASYVNGGDGTRFKLELIYYPTNTIDGNPESPKPKPNTVLATDIQNMGDDKESYRWNYLIKSHRAQDDYSAMIALGQTFSLYGSSNGSVLDTRSQEVMDVDEWMRVFAYESLGGINDTYNQGYPHNLQLVVRPEDGRVLALPWDQDFAFHQSTSMSLFGTGSNLRKIIEIPNNKHYFYGHLHDIINTTYNTTYLSYWIDHYADFAERDVSGEILNYVSSRRAYVLSQLPGQVSFQITTNGGNDFSVDETAVTIAGDGWINVREIRLGGSDEPLEVTWSAADRWQATIPIAASANLLSFEAFDFQGNPIGSDGITVTSTVDDRPLEEFLRVTELNYHPYEPNASERAQGFTDANDFEFIELYNVNPDLGDDPLDLTGVILGGGIDFEFTSVYHGPSLLVTEAGTGSLDYVEIQNVADQTLDTSGWIVAVNNPSEKGVNGVHSPWFLPDQITPGEILYRDDDDSNPGGYYWGEGISWPTPGPGWVMIVDDQGNVADFVAWGYSVNDVDAMEVDVEGSFQDITVDGEWNGAPLPSDGGNSLSLQRSGDGDHDDASDWAFTSPKSPNAKNTGLTVPFSGQLELASGEFVVVVRDEQAFRARYGTGISVAGEYSGKLNNGGEEITLTGPSLEMIAIFEYGDSQDPGWPDRADGNGSSLELINVAAVPAAGPGRTAFLENPANWRSSIDFLGSPGRAADELDSRVVLSEVLSRSDCPDVDAIELHNTTSEPVDVGGWYLSDDSDDLEKFQIPTGTTIPGYGYLVFYEGHCVFDDPLQQWVVESDQLNEFGGTGAKDFGLNGTAGDDVWLLKGEVGGRATHFVEHVEFGAALVGETFGRWENSVGQFYFYPMTASTLEPPGPNSGPRIGPELIISEVMHDPPDPDGAGGIDPNDLEFVEICNVTDDVVLLTDWRLTKGIDFDFVGGTSLDPGEALVVVPFDPANADKLANFRTHYGIVGAPVQIVGGHGDLIDGESWRLQLQDWDTPTQVGDPPEWITPHPLEDEVDYDATWYSGTNGDGDSLERLGRNLWGDDPASWAAATPSPGTVEFAAEVRGRYVFYNNSSFDTGPGKTAGDAKATDKLPLLPGAAASYANYTNYALGINGILIDVFDLANATALGQADFTFKVGNDDSPGDWTPLTTMPTVEVRQGEGPTGEDRVVLTWPDGTIQNQWLEVTMKANVNTGLATPDVFYFGNAVGETGDTTAHARVDATDILHTRNNPRPFFNPAEINSSYDFNRDQRVDAHDILIVRNSQTTFFTELILIDLSGGKTTGEDTSQTSTSAKDVPPEERPATGRPAREAASDAVFARTARQSPSRDRVTLDRAQWLLQFDPPNARHRPSRRENSAEGAVDWLLEGYVPFSQRVRSV